MLHYDNQKPAIPRTVDRVDWGTWSFTEDAVLCFILHGTNIMLIHKKTGLGKGKINAPGGRIQKGEVPVAAAIRETEEEIGLVVRDLTFRADLQFIFTDGYSLRGHVFFTQTFDGTPRATCEADPFWCPLDAIPYDKMWADDAYWLPLVLGGKNISGKFIFEQDTMLSYRIDEIEK